jgi:hypothetical protein
MCWRVPVAIYPTDREGEENGRQNWSTLTVVMKLLFTVIEHKIIIGVAERTNAQQKRYVYSVG